MTHAHVGAERNIRNAAEDKCNTVLRFELCFIKLDIW